MQKCWLNFVVVALLVFGQCFAAAHSAEFGTETHEHNGVVCSIAMLQDDYDTTLSLFSDGFQLAIKPQVCAAVAFSTDISPLFYFSPPSTGPPAFV